MKTSFTQVQVSLRRPRCRCGSMMRVWMRLSSYEVGGGVARVAGKWWLMKRKKSSGSCRNCRWGPQVKTCMFFCYRGEAGNPLHTVPASSLAPAGHCVCPCGYYNNFRRWSFSLPSRGAAPLCVGTSCCGPDLISALYARGFVAPNFTPAHSYEVFSPWFTHNKLHTHVYGRSPETVTTGCFVTGKGRFFLTPLCL